jgi:hypothetical protein
VTALVLGGGHGDRVRDNTYQLAASRLAANKKAPANLAVNRGFGGLIRYAPRKYMGRFCILAIRFT